MTTLLANAFDEASKLPETEQNALAKWLLEELHSDKRWAVSFSNSEDVLEKLADEALDKKKVRQRRWISTDYEVNDIGSFLEVV